MADPFEELSKEDVLGTPDFTAADIPAYDPKEQIAPPNPTKPGAFNLPMPGAGQPKLASTKDMQASLNNLTNNFETTANDPTIYAKAKNFDAGLDGLRFERYYNYPSLYNKLGFSPFRDNEALYNENANLATEMTRSLNQAGSLAWLGFKDAMTFGDLTDTETAKDYQKAMSIGSSSKGGATGFISNLALNSGYTVGIIGELALEELGLAFITGASVGGASPATIPAMVARGLNAGNKIRTGWKVGKNVIKALDALKDANKARQYFTKAAKGLGNFVNPLEETVDFMRGVGKVDGLDDIAKTAFGFASFYKDVRNVRLAWGESGLEGGMVRNDVSKELLDEHYKKYGRPPTDDEADAISQTALKAGTTTGMMNVGAIYFSNKIVLDGLFKEFKPLKRLADDFAEVAGGGRIFENIDIDEGAHFEKVSGIEGTMKTLKDPRNYAKTGLTYFKANLAEGLQETAQEIISGGVSESYKEDWRAGKEIKGGMLAAMTDNLLKQGTPQGLEVFMSGFLMGGMVQPIVRAPKYLKTTINRFVNPANYKALKDQKEQYLNETVNLLNELWNENRERLAPELENLINQVEYDKGIDQAQQDGNSKAFHDLTDMKTFDSVFAALKLGRFDTFIERLSDLKNLTEEEVKEKYKIDYATYQNTLDKSITRAESIKNRYDVVQEEMANPYRPAMFKATDPRRRIEQMKKDAWTAAQKEMIFSQIAFDRNIARKTSLLGSLQADTQLSKVPTQDITTLLSIPEMVAEVDLIKKEISGLSNATDSVSKANLKNKKEKLNLLLDLQGKLENVKNSTTATEAETVFRAKAIRVAKTAYKHYLKHLAKVNKDYAFDDVLDNSFQKVVDYYSLDSETEELNAAVNTILDPAAFVRIASRNEQIEMQKREQEQVTLREALSAFTDAFTKSKLTEVLYKKGMFFDPEALVALLEEGKMPQKLYYHEGDAITEVQVNSKDFREAVATIEDFVENLLDIPISNSAPTPYDTTTREKLAKDKRTYNDIAKQFGFETEPEVPLIAVLQAIIKSKYATPSEKLLAQQLSERAVAGETVTFVTNETGPSDYGTTRQSVIDARYSSENYLGGDIPIEVSILHAEIHRRADDALATDPEFRKEIEAVYAASAKHFKETADKEDPELYGLDSVEDFMAEAMTNSKFQAFLATVPYEATDATVWTKFVDSVVKLIGKVIGSNVSNTALNETLRIITTKLDIATAKPDSGKKTIPQANVAATPETTKITKKISIEDLIALPTVGNYNLAKELVKKYRDMNARLAEDGLNLMDPDYADKKDEEILNSKQFKVKFLSQAHLYPSIQKIIDTYNEKAGRVADAVAEPIIVGGKKKIGTAMRNVLINELGFTEKDIKSMNVNQAQAIIAKGKTKLELATIAEEEALAAENNVAYNATELWGQLENILLNARSLDALKEAHNEVLDFLAKETVTGQTGWTVLGNDRGPNDASIADVIEDLVAKRKEDLRFSFEFEDIKKGQTIILKGRGKNDGQYVLVTKVNAEKGLIYVRTTGSKRKAITPITREDVKNRVKYVYKKGMEDPDLVLPSEDITDEDNEIAASNLAAAKSKADSAPSVADASDVDDLDEIDNDCNKP